MFEMSVDTRTLERLLNGIAKSQMPFAVALGINDVAGQISAAEPSGLERDLDRPTPFTKRGLSIQRASKRRLIGVVGFKPVQAAYLGLQATGGTRRAKRRAVVVPVSAWRNKYGNVPRGALKRALARPDTFSGTIKGVAGVWQRPKKATRKSGGAGAKGAAKGPKLLATYKARVSYRSRLQFVDRAERLARREIGPAIARRLAAAVKTSR